MQRRSLISEVGHVSIQVRDLEAAEECATNVVGLTVSDRSPHAVWLTHGVTHHSLRYVQGDTDAVDHVGLVARDGDAVEELRARIEAAGLAVRRDGPADDGVSDGFTFVGPEGFELEIYSEMEAVGRGADARGVRPARLGHVNFSPREPGPMQEMLIDLLGFRVSDRAGDGAFLRCNVDHHGVGVFPGHGQLHHYAWEVASIAELGALADLVDSRGGSVLWGPARHGIGRNIATYFQEPSGMVIEYYADMQRIYDDDHHVPTNWSMDGHKWFSLWGPQIPDGFTTLGLPPAPVKVPSAQSGRRP
jgi:catechol 2,3-dioxygenase